MKDKPADIIPQVQTAVKVYHKGKFLGILMFSDILDTKGARGEIRKDGPEEMKSIADELEIELMDPLTVRLLLEDMENKGQSVKRIV